MTDFLDEVIQNSIDLFNAADDPLDLPSFRVKLDLKRMVRRELTKEFPKQSQEVIEDWANLIAAYSDVAVGEDLLEHPRYPELITSMSRALAKVFRAVKDEFGQECALKLVERVSLKVD